MSNVMYAQAARGNGTATGKRKATRNYPNSRPMSTYRPKIPQRAANRTTKTQMTWRDRAALSLLALAGNLQAAQHLSRRDEVQGWGLFSVLLQEFIERSKLGAIL